MASPPILGALVDDSFHVLADDSYPATGCSVATTWTVNFSARYANSTSGFSSAHPLAGNSTGTKEPTGHTECAEAGDPAGDLMRGLWRSGGQDYTD